MDKHRCLWTLYLILGCFTFGLCFDDDVAGSAGNKWQKAAEEDKSITCYQCNSEYDPRCGDPFDPYSLGTVNCSMKKPREHLKDFKPVLCRKTVQKVQGHTRVIRGCGYVRDPRDDKKCMRRTGTHDVIVNYCSCTKSLCNSAFSTRPPPSMLLVLLPSATTSLALVSFIFNTMMMLVQQRRA